MIYELDDIYKNYEQARTLPYSLKVLLENLIRNFDGESVTTEQIEALATWDEKAAQTTEIQFTPARIIMQDFTGVPCLVDLATVREAVQEFKGAAEVVNPQKTTSLVIDHSIQIDACATDDALDYNMKKEFVRNRERYEFLKWGSSSFNDFNVIPPGVGIIHQVNIEHLTKVVCNENGVAFFDSCIGTDSHTTMVNGLGVLGWGVGGIEAEAGMLGQPIPLLIPQVIGVYITGELPDGITATDVVLTITQKLRAYGVVGKIVEFYGPGIKNMSASLRTTVSNMCPEFGATAALFAIDERTIEYLRLTGRKSAEVKLMEEYAKKQGVFSIPENTRYTDVIKLNLNEVKLSIAGPKRPQDRIDFSSVTGEVQKTLDENAHGDDTEFLKNADVVIASITSCTNTSNPEVILAAGLLAKNAVEQGLKVPKHVRTSLAPGSRVVASYLQKAGLQEHLNLLGFNVVGFGCATCIGNSGPNAPEISQEIDENNLMVAAVLSGNRNFEGRINPDVKLNYLASAQLVVAYALAGTMLFDFENTALGVNPKTHKQVFLRDILPSSQDVEELSKQYITPKLYVDEYKKALCGDKLWQDITLRKSSTFDWNPTSTYIKKSPYFEGMKRELTPVKNIVDAHILALFGDSITTDHISPAGSIPADSPAGSYLKAHGVDVKDFNSYGSRRGNHEVMVRGTFANTRLNNELIKSITGSEQLGGYTVNFLKNEVDWIYNAAMDYERAKTPLVVLAGKEYGTGSSRDWAAKGTALLGVRAVLAQSFERIHRSNLIGMGILPLQFFDGDSAESLNLTGAETISIWGVEELNSGRLIQDVLITAHKGSGTSASASGEIEFRARLRIDTPTGLAYYLHGGILQFVLRSKVLK
ncbi:MAG: aconitate hydratase AcnA [Candidatus Ancillula trichonymphae]|jgi:aconitate hydratase|nr:aconitate hydratase AcnA [Candidatus Ancillula trichonymphae]